MTLICDKEKTEVREWAKDIERKSLQVLYRVQETFNLCIDVNGPLVILANKMVAEGYARLQNRGVTVRFITEITKSKVDHCEEMMKFATKFTRGTGLGLFISKSIIEAHDSRISGENNRERGRDIVIHSARAAMIIYQNKAGHPCKTKTASFARSSAAGYLQG